MSVAQASARCVVRTGLLMRIAAAFRGVTVAAMPAGHRLLALSDVPDRLQQIPDARLAGLVGVDVHLLEQFREGDAE